MKPETWTVSEAVRHLSVALREAGVAEPATKAEWAIAHMLGCGRLETRVRRDQPLNARQRKQWVRAGERLLAHEPLQYVLGETEFYGRLFAADARALIPRPETEELVARTLKEEALRRIPRPRIADIGTGSGCVAVTLALERPDAIVFATDRFTPALALARKNARRYGVEGRIVWRKTDLLDGFSQASLEAIVANLPYIPSRDIAKLERQIRDYEPRPALDGGPDGLALIRRLVAQAPQVLTRPAWVFLEIAEDQGTAVQALLEKAGFHAIEIARDLGGHPRIAIGRFGDVVGL